ncbi:c-type cytochrome [Sneathiella sp.]|uniref:c-type cytochrome n=1 Tax=Sneathiella sp. TaxID=1964365 RepID=UPI002FE30580
MSSLVKNIVFVLLILLIIAISYVLLQESEQQDSLSGGPIADVTSATLTPRGEEGQLVFDTECAYCHGFNASGRDGVGPPLVHMMYGPDSLDDAAFGRAIRSGAAQSKWPFGDMPPDPEIKDEEIAALLVYVRELQKANGIE